MPWVRFTDDYLANDKITPLSAYARLLDMAAIVYSARELRDGHLSMADVETVAAVARVPRWQRSVAELVAANRWVPESSGYAIHDYLDYQPSRAHVLAERAAARDRQRARRSPGDVRPDTPRTSEEISPESGRSSDPPVPGPGTGVPEYAAAAVRSGPSLAPGRARGSGDLQPLGAVLNGSQRQRRRQQENLSEDEVPDEVRERLNQPPIEEQQP